MMKEETSHFRKKHVKLVISFLAKITIQFNFIFIKILISLGMTIQTIFDQPPLFPTCLLALCWPFMSDHDFSVLSFSLLSWLFVLLCAMFPLFSFVPLNVFFFFPQCYHQQFPFIFCILNSARQILQQLRDPHCNLLHSSFISHIDSSYVLCLYFFQKVR